MQGTGSPWSEAWNVQRVERIRKVRKGTGSIKHTTVAVVPGDVDWCRRARGPAGSGMPGRPRIPHPRLAPRVCEASGQLPAL